ncbi:MAG: S-ribosylhomocysteine lyase [Oscillospiraceae bacterium]|jgi:S-ribosylhomocysteine lyase|nr:S-ribosylhomocysteine lyase [Oscillospiraceae bacterium]
MKPSSVKSFSRDHSKIEGGTVTIYDQYVSGNCIIKKADIRFRTPNTDYISPEASHTVEHLLADSLYKITSGSEEDAVLDLSPMGCLTGFYCTFMTGGRMEKEDFWPPLMEEALKYADIPGAHPDSCGNYKFHDLPAAKAALAEFLSDFNKRPPGTRVLALTGSC